MPRDIVLVPLGGNRVVPGLRGLAGGPLDAVPAAGDAPPPPDPSPGPVLGGSAPPDVPLGGSPEAALFQNGSAR